MHLAPTLLALYLACWVKAATTTAPACPTPSSPAVTRYKCPKGVLLVCCMEYLLGEAGESVSTGADCEYGVLRLRGQLCCFWIGWDLLMDWPSLGSVPVTNGELGPGYCMNSIPGCCKGVVSFLDPHYACFLSGGY